MTLARLKEVPLSDVTGPFPRPDAEGSSGNAGGGAEPARSPENLGKRPRGVPSRATRKRIAALEKRLGEAEGERLEVLRELERTRAELQWVRAELTRREQERNALDSREAYRFAATLVAAKHDPRLAWKVPVAAASLVTPKPIREPLRAFAANPGDSVRSGLARVRVLLENLSMAAGTPRSRSDVRTRALDVAIRASVVAGDPLRCGHRVMGARPWRRDAPLVSVIVPCFNYGRFLKEAVDSVLGQTLQDLEIVIVEGGSTDGVTPAVVRAMDHPRILKLFQPRPTKVGDNRLAGLRAARGKYAVFLDADDVLEPTYLEKAVMALELTGVELAYPSVQLFGNQSSVWETADEFTLASMARANMVPTVTMFRVAAWKSLRIGYGSHLDVEDYDFWLRFAERGARGVKIHEPLMLYRVHGRSLTDALRGKHEEAVSRIHAEHAEMLSPERVERVTRFQRRPMVPVEATDLPRVRARSALPLRIALANPFLVVGGSDHLLQQVFADHGDRGASLLVYSTLDTPPAMGTSASGYARLTPHVFELPKLLPEAFHPDVILHLLKSRDINLLLLAGSRRTYELLPRIKAELPGIRVVDHLYNPVGHLASNREFAGFIDFVIAANQDVERALVAAGECPERIEVIRHGIDTAEYDPEKVPRRDDLEGLPLDDRTRLVLFAGRLSEEKGALRFVEIVDRLRERSDLAFAMIGDGPLAGEVDRRIREHGLEGRVARLGFVADARPFLRRADVLVIPSDIDGLPLVSLEGMALGVPVVASRIGALPDLVEPGTTGDLVDPDDVAGFASAVEAVLATGASGRAATCRARVVAGFDVRSVRDRYYDLFQRLVRRPEAAGRTGVTA